MRTTDLGMKALVYRLPDLHVIADNAWDERPNHKSQTSDVPAHRVWARNKLRIGRWKKKKIPNSREIKDIVHKMKLHK